MNVAAARWKAENLPTGMSAVALDDSDGLCRAERILEHSRIAEVEVEFAENKLTESHIVPLVESREKVYCSDVMRRRFTIAVQ